ncbi:hypothetical protein E2C01_094007 [Portunus trituberculatus]|uniref:Uncharacterized protein n=1 Tax=Portunus trituberculatus TaxID=210409 RepID=A0A5B7JKL4_PORTR|nr:hypothetical protein [Portunus trituberculatus]
MIPRFWVVTPKMRLRDMGPNMGTTINENDCAINGRFDYLRANRVFGWQPCLTSALA